MSERTKRVKFLIPPRTQNSAVQQSSPTEWYNTFASYLSDRVHKYVYLNPFTPNIYVLRGLTPIIWFTLFVNIDKKLQYCDHQGLS